MIREITLTSQGNDSSVSGDYPNPPGSAVGKPMAADG